MLLFRRFRLIKTARPAPVWLRGFSRFNRLMAFVAVVLAALFQGYRLSFFGMESVLLPAVIVVAGVGAFVEVLIVRIFTIYHPTRPVYRWLYLTLGLLIVASLVFRQFAIALALTVLYHIVVIANQPTSTGFMVDVLANLRYRAPFTLMLSFALLIVIGTILLTFPAASPSGRPLALIDALFTATSATCVTGLVVRDTGTHFTLFGQLVILILMQLGGLGIMTFSTSIAIILGHRLAPGERRVFSEMVEPTRAIDIARAVRYILLFTILAESAGFLVLFFRWLGVFPSTGQAFYYALFHSVSAFCNAGFSLFSDSFIRYQSDIVVNLVIMALIVTGGLGFAVVQEFINRNTFRIGLRRPVRHLTTHSRIVLVTTGILLGTGAVIFFFLEYDRTLASLSLGTKLLVSLFQSVTARTAGFNTVPLNNLHPATIFTLIVLMFIGASPGGTGGGIKTTTFAILLLAVRARLTNQEELVVGRRTVGKDIVYRAVSIAVVALGVVGAGFFLLLLFEPASFPQLLFETVSAFGTVGLSTGITSTLKTISRLVIILVMFIGRIGPLTLVLAMATPRPRQAVTYPQARIMVG